MEKHPKNHPTEVLWQEKRVGAGKIKGKRGSGFQSNWKIREERFCRRNGSERGWDCCWLQAFLWQNTLLSWTKDLASHLPLHCEILWALTKTLTFQTVFCCLTFTPSLQIMTSFSKSVRRGEKWNYWLWQKSEKKNWALEGRGGRAGGKQDW